MTTNALVVGLAFAIFSVWGSAVTAEKTGDACALLQVTEIQVLTATGKVGAGQSNTDALGSRLSQIKCSDPSGDDRAGEREHAQGASKM